jgi:DNA-binding transcriptional LysR family regulator
MIPASSDDPFKPGARRRRTPLDIRQLEIFCKIKELKSFSKAADEIHLTQPTLSQHISSLEGQLGVRLFDRLGREVVLTKAGEILYRYARQILSLRREAIQSIHLFLGKTQGDLSIGGSTIPGEYILPALLGQFKKRFENVRITVKVANTMGIIEDLVQNRIELGVVGAKVENRAIEYRHFVEDELVLVVPPDHRWSNRKTATVDELLEEPFVMREAGSGSRISVERQLKPHGGPTMEQFNVVAELGSTESVKQAVKSGLGVSLVSKRAVAEELKSNLLKKVGIRGVRFLRPFYIATNKRRSKSPLLEALIEFLAQAPVP